MNQQGETMAETMDTEAVDPRRQAEIGFKAVFRTLLGHKLAVIGGIITILLFSMAVFAPWLTSYDPIEPDFYNTLQGPSKEHWLGTDDLGRDLFARIVYGARVSMTVGMACTLFSLVFGSCMGLLSGFKGGTIDQVIMRVVDSIMVFPGLLFVLILSAAIGPGMKSIIIAISIFGWAGFARVIRGQVLSVREEPYVEAARALGASDLRIMFKYVLPNSLAPMIVMGALGLGAAVGMESGAAFLGIGVQPPTPSWGRELRIGYSYLTTAPLFSIAPGALITSAILAFSFLGDGLRDAMDPRIRGEGKKL
jgi:peptide/nickel transport system permease protein